MDISVVNGEKIRYWDLMKCGWKYSLESSASFHIDVYPERYCCYPKNDPFVSLSAEGILWFKQGYSWDGASGLTLDTKSSMRGALIHDGLYQLMGNGNLSSAWRQKADELLRDICKQDGMWWWRAELWYRAVRLAGGPSAKAGREEVAEKVLTAP